MAVWPKEMSINQCGRTKDKNVTLIKQLKCSQIIEKIYLISKISPVRRMNIRTDGISGEPSNVGKRFISLNTCAGRANCRVV